MFVEINVLTNLVRK